MPDPVPVFLPDPVRVFLPDQVPDFCQMRSPFLPDPVPRFLPDRVPCFLPDPVRVFLPDPVPVYCQTPVLLFDLDLMAFTARYNSLIKEEQMPQNCFSSAPCIEGHFSKCFLQLHTSQHPVVYHHCSQIFRYFLGKIPAISFGGLKVEELSVR